MTSWGSTSCHSWPQNLSSYLLPVRNSFAPMSVMTLSYRLPCCNSWARQFLEKEIVQENCLSGLQWFFFMFYEFCSFIWVKWCNWKNNGKEETTDLSYWKTVKLNNFANLVWTIWCRFCNSELLINTKTLVFRGLWSFCPYVSLCLSKIHSLPSLNPISL